MNRVSALLVPLLLLAGAGCGSELGPQAITSPTATTVAAPTPPSGGVPTPGAYLTPSAPTTDLEYGNLEDLRDAAVAAGYTCADWDQDDKVSLAAESGSCSDADVFATYVTESDLQDQVDQYKENAKMLEDAGIDADPTLVGPNWTVNGNEDEISSLQDGIGGKILR